MGESHEPAADLSVNLDGFRYISVRVAGESSGSGHLEGPDGSRAGIQWEVGDGSYIMRLEGPGTDHWGVYRVGFARPVRSPSDLRANLEPLMPKFQVIYSRLRVH